MKQKNKKYEELEWTSEMVSDFWDWQSQYPEVYFTYQFGGDIAFNFKKHLENKKRILDYGCGVGYLIPHLCKYSDNVSGTDLSPSSINKVNEKFKKNSSFCGAKIVSDLILENKKFDLITAVEIIEHLYDDNLNELIDNIDSLLSDNGIVIFTTPNNENREKNMIYCPSTGKIFHRWQHVRSWDVGSLKKYLESKNYEIVEIYETNLIQPRIKKGDGLIPFLKSCVKKIRNKSDVQPHLVCIAKK